MSSGGFKASKYFSSMKEVEEMLEEMKKSSSPEEYLALKKALGLAQQEGDYREVEGIGKIDRSIADFVEELNRNGYQTLSSCSGVRLEHPKNAEPASGYLSFIQDNRANQIEGVCRELGFSIREGEVYLKPALTVVIEGRTDDEIVEKWRSLHSALLENK